MFLVVGYQDIDNACVFNICAILDFNFYIFNTVSLVQTKT